MIYLGNGMYSDAGSSNELMHYGVLGMKWGVRKARGIANQMERYRATGIKQSLKSMYKSGQISKEEYRRAKIKNKGNLKRGLRDNKQSAKQLKAMLRGEIKAGKTKGIKARSLRDNAYASAEKMMPGFKNVEDRRKAMSRNALLFGTMGVAASSPSYTKAYKDMSNNNRSNFDNAAKQLAKPQYSESDAWKAIGEYYARKQKK